MGRYIGPSCRLCRREGTKLFLKGARCETDKCAVMRRNYAPGMHGLRRGKVTEYGLQLREKQKVKRMYGLLERQFRNYFKRAAKQRGVTGYQLLLLLERRLDNVVYRMGFASSRAQARQLVRHRHFQVNGKVVNIPSYLVSVGDVVQVREKSRRLQVIEQASEMAQSKGVADWVQVDFEALKGKVLRFPEREEIAVDVDESMIVELYSR